MGLKESVVGEVGIGRKVCMAWFLKKLNPSWTARWLLLLVLELPDLTNPYYRKDMNNFFV